MDRTPFLGRSVVALGKDFKMTIDSVRKALYAVLVAVSTVYGLAYYVAEAGEEGGRTLGPLYKQPEMLIYGSQAENDSADLVLAGMF